MNKPENVELKVRRRNGKVHCTLSFDVEEDSYCDKAEIRARLERNTKWLTAHLYTWADFDDSFTTLLFADALQKLGEGLLRWNNLMCSQANGRRAIQAAHMLRDAYSYDLHDDPGYQNWNDKCRLEWVDAASLGFKGHNALQRIYHYGPHIKDPDDYAAKMYNIIEKRVTNVTMRKKREVWEFIHKHIESFWD